MLRMTSKFNEIVVPCGIPIIPENVSRIRGLRFDKVETVVLTMGIAAVRPVIIGRGPAPPDEAFIVMTLFPEALLSMIHSETKRDQ